MNARSLLLTFIILIIGFLTNGILADEDHNTFIEEKLENIYDNATYNVVDITLPNETISYDYYVPGFSGAWANMNTVFDTTIDCGSIIGEFGVTDPKYDNLFNSIPNVDPFVYNKYENYPVLPDTFTPEPYKNQAYEFPLPPTDTTIYETPTYDFPSSDFNSDVFSSQTFDSSSIFDTQNNPIITPDFNTQSFEIDSYSSPAFDYSSSVWDTGAYSTPTYDYSSSFDTSTYTAPTFDYSSSFNSFDNTNIITPADNSWMK